MSYWTHTHFEVFTIDGLQPRMEALQRHIQPLFRELGEQFSAQLSAYGLGEFYPHVAKHARRTVHPPNDSWVAFAPSKRGYKALPHFQIGLWDDQLFITLVVIYENNKKQEIAEALRAHLELLRALPETYYINGDHTKKNVMTLREAGDDGQLALLDRLQNIKRAELVIGRVLTVEEATSLTKRQFFEIVQETFDTLFPLYQLYVGTVHRDA